MIERPIVRAIAVAVFCAAAFPASAAECPDLLARGAMVADSYVLDFGARDKLYVYVMRLPGGVVETCTSYKPLAGG